MVLSLALLYASLVASLVSVFFAILAKQWLNRYVLADVRGSTIERSQNRQRKLDSITTGRFETLIEVLPLLQQLAFLLLSYAVSVYLWAFNTQIAMVVLSVTVVVTATYLYLTWAAVVDPSSPYQTLISLAISHSCRMLQQVLLHLSHPPASSRRSETVGMTQANMEAHDSWWSRDRITHFLKEVPRKFPRTLTANCFRLRKAVLRVLVIGFRVNGWLSGGFSSPEQGPDALDIPCVSWILQMSPDKGVQRSALEHLATIEPLAGFRPTLVASCFDVLIGCVKVINGNVAVAKGQEQLATVSATCFLRTFSHLSVMDPMSGVLGDVCRRFSKVFPPGTNFQGFPPFHYILGVIHRLLSQDREHQQRPRIEWRDYKPPGHEHAIVARALTELAQSEHRRSERRKKVPRWIIRFTLHSLSLDPPPSTSVVIDCLSVIAIDLGCEVSGIRTTALSERYDPA